ncbi:MAG: hypothetical protein ACXIVF_14535 [Rhizobiaceae bacterium]
MKGADMGVHAAGGGERAVRRILALLVSLAVLAERAAARSWPVRWLVLRFLRRAEPAASRFVFEATGAPPAGVPALTIANDPEDAIRLAARFHALAAALGALLAMACRLNGQAARPGDASGHVAHWSGGPSPALRIWAPEPDDTS